jgi:hypothetical protein
VFVRHQGLTVILDGALQTGFQTHLFGQLNTGPDGATSFATSMAEAGMNAVDIQENQPSTTTTMAEVQAIHKACVNFPPVGPLP